MTSGASSPSATFLQALSNAVATAPTPAYAASTSAAASYASSRGPTICCAAAYHRSATSHVVFSLPSGQSNPTTHSSASYAQPGRSQGQ